MITTVPEGRKIIAQGASPGVMIVTTTKAPEGRQKRKAMNAFLVKRGGTMRLVSLQKTNGKLDPTGRYTMEFDARVEFLKDGRWLQLAWAVEPWGAPPPKPGEPVVGCPYVKKGQVEKVPCWLEFEKMENGWRPFGDVYWNMQH